MAASKSAFANGIGTRNFGTMNGQSNELSNVPCEINSDQTNFNKHSITTTENIKAFSLIELLVVISIISLPLLIASLPLPGNVSGPLAPLKSVPKYTLCDVVSEPAVQPFGCSGYRNFAALLSTSQVTLLRIGQRI